MREGTSLLTLVEQTIRQTVEASRGDAEAAKAAFWRACKRKGSPFSASFRILVRACRMGRRPYGLPARQWPKRAEMSGGSTRFFGSEQISGSSQPMRERCSARSSNASSPR